MEHNSKDLIALFNATFLTSENTILVQGQGEPIYLPSDSHSPHHRIEFAHGFFRSALHEIAHWTIAGPSRRKLPDYGYWYKPDGRNALEQLEFEKVEVKPQAIEWILSVAANTRFTVSVDNLAGGMSAWRPFETKVRNLVLNILQGDVALPPRARIFACALSTRYETGEDWKNPKSYRDPNF